MTESQRSKRIPELDGWRAVSVLLVICSHALIQSTTNPEYPWKWVHEALLSHVLFYAGPLGVKTFFVISGFVICRLLVKEEAEQGQVSMCAFYYRRAFRILPPFLMFVSVLAALLGVGLVAGSWRSVICHILFLGDLDIYQGMHTIGHTWSLAVEEQFYLVFPAVFVLLPRRWLSPLLLCTFFLCTAWTVISIRAMETPLIMYNARLGFACIALGAVLANGEDAIRNWAVRVPLAVVAAAGLVLLGHPMGRETALSPLYDGLVVPVLIGLVLMASLDRGSWWRAFLCSRPMQTAGLMSYGIYLWQQLFLAPAGGYRAGGQWIPCLLPAIVLIVPASYYLVEKPAMRLGRVLSDRARMVAEERRAVAVER